MGARFRCPSQNSYTPREVAYANYQIDEGLVSGIQSDRG
jgi:hypothetical protein